MDHGTPGRCMHLGGRCVLGWHEVAVVLALALVLGPWYFLMDDRGSVLESRLSDEVRAAVSIRVVVACVPS